MLALVLILILILRQDYIVHPLQHPFPVYPVADYMFLSEITHRDVKGELRFSKSFSPAFN